MRVSGYFRYVGAILCAGLVGFCAALTPAATTSQSSSQPASEPAGHQRGKITLHWRIESADENYGFILYRAESESGPWTRVNKKIIPGIGGTTADPHEFEYVDTDVIRGKDYWYRLIEVSLSGVESQMGQIKAHCRTVEEDRVHEKEKALEAELKNASKPPRSPIIDDNYVTFLYKPAEGEEQVHLRGDWTGWESEGIKLKQLRDSGYLYGEVGRDALGPELKAHYVFLVDGQERLDPLNPESTTLPDGRKVSVFSLTGAGGAVSQPPSTDN